MRLPDVLRRIYEGLFKALVFEGEIFVLRLITAHNLHLYGGLVREAREAIVVGRYAKFAKSWPGALAAT